MVPPQADEVQMLRAQSKIAAFEQRSQSRFGGSGYPERALRKQPARSEAWLLLGNAHIAQRHRKEATDPFCPARQLGNTEASELCENQSLIAP